MGNRLVGADRAVELLALLGVVDRHLHRALGDPGELRAERDQGPVGGPLHVAGERIATVRRDPRVAAGSVDQLDRLDLGVAHLDQDGVVAVVEDEHAGPVSIGHKIVGPGLERRRTALPARGNSGEPALPLLIAPRVTDEQARRGVGQERRGRAGVAQLLAQDRQLDRPQAQSPVLLGDGDPGPAQLADLAPERVVVAARLGCLAHLGQRGALGQHLAGGLLDRPLLVVEAEVHRRRRSLAWHTG